MSSAINDCLQKFIRQKIALDQRASYSTRQFRPVEVYRGSNVLFFLLFAFDFYMTIVSDYNNFGKTFLHLATMLQIFHFFHLLFFLTKNIRAA